MVGNVAKKAVAAALTGAMTLSAAAPLALAGYAPTSGANKVKSSSTTPTEFTYWDRIGGDDRYGTMKKLVDSMARSNEWEFKEFKLYSFGAANIATLLANRTLNNKYVLVDDVLYNDITNPNYPSTRSWVDNQITLSDLLADNLFDAYCWSVVIYDINPTQANKDARDAAETLWIEAKADLTDAKLIAAAFAEYAEASLLGVKDTDDILKWTSQDWIKYWWTNSGNMWTGYGKNYEQVTDLEDKNFFPYEVNGGWYVPFEIAALSGFFTPAHVYQYIQKNTAKFVTFSLEEVKYDDLWNARAAVLATGDNFPDALSANGLAGSLDIPLILTRTGALSSEAKDLITSHKISKLYVMGGEAAISQAVRDELKKMNVAIIEVAGENRQQTSFEALKLTRTVDQVIVATGKAFADALSIGPLAYRYGIPVVLANNDGTLSEEIADYLKNTSSLKEVIIVGGDEAVSDSVCGQIGMSKKYWRIAGEDRYDTSIKVAQFLVQGSYYNYVDGKWTPGYEDVTTYFSSPLDKLNGFSYDSIYVARGDLFPDALAGAQVAAGAKAQKAWETYGAPIILVKDGGSQAASWLKGYYTIKRDGLYGWYKEVWEWEKTTPGFELKYPDYDYERNSSGNIINVNITKYGHVLGGEKAISNKTVDTLNKAVKDAKDD